MLLKVKVMLVTEIRAAVGPWYYCLQLVIVLQLVFIVLIVEVNETDDDDHDDDDELFLRYS